MSIGDWMETPQGGKITGYAFGFGAAVVILGALFKIQHWPGASYILTAGMGTEAILFAITAFGKPHPTYHWDNVFPQLMESHDEDGLVAEGAGIAGFGGGGGVSGNLNITGGEGNLDLSSIASLSEESMKKLSEGISKLSDTANQLADLSPLKGATETLIQNMTNASSSVAGFVVSQNEINASSEALLSSYKTVATDLSAVSQSTGATVSTISDINKNLSSINAVYELQLKSVGEQNQAIQSVSANWNKVNTVVAATQSGVEAYQAEANKLAQQVADLNKVYGNMLNAVAI
jgi:septal ring factor EnvC (AmiA/AmiB activator)